MAAGSIVWYTRARLTSFRSLGHESLRLVDRRRGLCQGDPSGWSKSENCMLLECLSCRTLIETADFKITWKAHGGFECPECKQLLQFSQPHAIFRRGLAVVISALLLLVFGVQRIVWLVLASLLLWPFMQLVVNGYCFRAMATSLKPLKPIRPPKLPKLQLEERDDRPLELFDRRGKMAQPPRK